jgi:putative endonuclease
MHWLAALTEPLWLNLDRRLPLGKRGENAAARYLRRLGYVIVARGQRGYIGELDLVAVDRRTIVFVEVKTRASQDAGHPADAVDDAKQRRLTRLALSYMQRHDLLECRSRFDVVAVTWRNDRQSPQIEHFQHAFEPVGCEGLFS